ncbi:MAG: YhdH/YhfP family quinone oxidoreductase [Chloroflexi bacterium]|nr:YhdH/YhfP family quinone oxidoreductase [Chloroflexota bacterium]
MDENTTFKALVADTSADGGFTRQVEEKRISDLPAGDLLVRVKYSSLNYKDALSASGNRGVTKNYPHIPGIDAAGEVIESSSPDFHLGEQVILTGYDFGSNAPGGFSQVARVPVAWAVKLPAGLSLEESMAYGTGGFTAALCIARLQELGITPERGEILVTGASGGVGSFAVALLAQNGYTVAAATGKTGARQFLLDLGAHEVLPREQIDDTSGRPLLKGRWAGAVDTVGGNYLATALRSIQPMGAVAACGNAASADLPLTVYPFILRGVSLLGVDTSRCPADLRRRLWQKIAGEWKLPRLERLYATIGLTGLDGAIERILHGGVRGRLVVDCSY